jgi:hypothetical protein
MPARKGIKMMLAASALMGLVGGGCSDENDDATDLGALTPEQPSRFDDMGATPGATLDDGRHPAAPPAGEVQEPGQGGDTDDGVNDVPDQCEDCESNGDSPDGGVDNPDGDAGGTGGGDDGDDGGTGGTGGTGGVETPDGLNLPNLPVRFTEPETTPPIT